MAIPAGYGQSAIGAALFAVGGVADMIWHQIFGVELGIDALLSPTHLVLFCGGALLVSGPVRSFHFRTGTSSLSTLFPPTLAVLGIAAIVAFSLSYLSAFLADYPTIAVSHAPEGTEEHNMAEAVASAGLASYVVTSLVVVVPLTYLIRFRLARLGSAVLMVTSLALLAAILGNFRNAGIVIAAVAAGTIIDVVLLGLRRRNIPPRVQELVVAALLPLLVWPGQLIATNIVQPVLWSLEMTTGAVIISALVSFASVYVLGHFSGGPRGQVTTARRP